MSTTNEVHRAIILAAGKGSRLKSLTENARKALMSIAGKPAIVRVINNLVAQGVHEICINIHHHGEQIRAVVGNGSAFNAIIHYSEEEALLDSGGGVRTALDLLPGDGAVVIHNSDIMSNINIKALTKICPAQGCALALVNNPKHHSDGDFTLNGQIVRQEKANPLTFSGVSVWQASTLKQYQCNQTFPLIQPIQEVIQREQCVGLTHHGHWFDIGRPRDLVQANRFYRLEGL